LQPAAPPPRYSFRATLFAPDIRLPTSDLRPPALSNSVSGLSSTSTTAQIEAVFDNNAGYSEGAGDVSGCQAFLTAARMLLRRYSAEAQKANAGNRLRMDENLRQIQNQIIQASEWLNTALLAGNQATTPTFQFLRGTPGY
jgi:hypothetical protein